MYVLRVAFPSASKANKVNVFEWSFKDIPCDLTWDALVNRLCEQTRLKRKKFYVFWHDRTEYCTISNTATLQDAIRHMSLTYGTKTPLIYVVPVAPDEDKYRLSSFFDHCSVDELPKDFREFVDHAEADEENDYSAPDNSSQPRLQCSECEKTEWSGDKFACVVCPHVVFCDQCFPRSVHDDHPIVITRGNNSYPNPILQAVRRVAGSINQDDSSDEGSDQSDDESEEDCSSRCCSTGSQLSNSINPEIAEAVEAVQGMGFNITQDELIKLAQEENGDISSMVQRLVNSM